MKVIFLLLFIFLTGCSVKPTDLKVVEQFEVARYLGSWYEIARLPNRFEKNLMKVTANYSLQSNGGIRVINKGFNIKSQEWEEAKGSAYFTGDNSVGALKVSFFGPFYGGYNILSLDQKEYQYALVAGPERKYLWVLARTPELDKSIIKDLVEQAKIKGFPVEKLEWIKH